MSFDRQTAIEILRAKKELDRYMPILRQISAAGIPQQTPGPTANPVSVRVSGALLDAVDEGVYPGNLTYRSYETGDWIEFNEDPDCLVAAPNGETLTEDTIYSGYLSGIKQPADPDVPVEYQGFPVVVVSAFTTSSSGSAPIAARLTTSSGGKWKWVPLAPSGGGWADAGSESADYTAVPLALGGDADLASMPSSGQRVELFYAGVGPVYGFNPLRGADGTHSGVVTLSAQTLGAGNKTLPADATVVGSLGVGAGLTVGTTGTFGAGFSQVVIAPGVSGSTSGGISIGGGVSGRTGSFTVTSDGLELSSGPSAVVIAHQWGSRMNGGVLDLGILATRIFTDADGNVHNVNVSGGLVVGWTVTAPPPPPPPP